MEHRTQSQDKLHNLGNLPLELLHRIITVGLCESALALSQTNKRFNSICRRPFIYVEIIEDKLKSDSTVQGRSDIKWHKTAGLDTENDPLVCARWALADSRARAASSDNNIALRNVPLELLEWEPYLLAMNR